MAVTQFLETPVGKAIAASSIAWASRCRDPASRISRTTQICHNLEVSRWANEDLHAEMEDQHLPHGARLRAEHYRDKAAQFRELAEIEHLPSLRRHLRRLAAQHDKAAADINTPPASESDDQQVTLGEAQRQEYREGRVDARQVD